jgi:hypothetical protein
VGSTDEEEEDDDEDDVKNGNGNVGDDCDGEDTVANGDDEVSGETNVDLSCIVDEDGVRGGGEEGDDGSEVNDDMIKNEGKNIIIHTISMNSQVFWFVSITISYLFIYFHYSLFIYVYYFIYIQYKQILHYLIIISSAEFELIVI